MIGLPPAIILKSGQSIFNLFTLPVCRISGKNASADDLQFAIKQFDLCSFYCKSPNSSHSIFSSYILSIAVFSRNFPDTIRQKPEVDLLFYLEKACLLIDAQHANSNLLYFLI